MSEMSDLLVTYLNQEQSLGFAKPGDVGLDLPITIDGSRVLPDLEHFIRPHGDEQDEIPWLEIPSGGFAEIEIGIKVKLPNDAWAIITGRSSTAWKKRIIVINGIIDTDYVGPLRNLIYNPNPVPIRVHEGDKLAQLILIKKYHINNIVKVDELPKTIRGETGFGSSTPDQK